MRKVLYVAVVGMLLVACQSRHERLQKEIVERREALKERQDSSLKSAQAALEQIDRALQQASADYERARRESEDAHARGVATAEQLTRTTKLRLLRDSLQGVFDGECAKIRYIHRLQRE